MRRVQIRTAAAILKCVLNGTYRLGVCVAYSKPSSLLDLAEHLIVGLSRIGWPYWVSRLVVMGLIVDSRGGRDPETGVYFRVPRRRGTSDLRPMVLKLLSDWLAMEQINLEIAGDSCFVLFLLLCPSLTPGSGAPPSVRLFRNGERRAGHDRLLGADEIQQANNLAQFLHKRGRMLDTERAEANTDAPV